VTLYRSAGRAAEFVNVGRNVVVASKSGPVETVPTVPVATALNYSKRVDEHMGAVRMADFNSSALSEHAWNAGHRVDWSEVTILDQHENLHIRLSLEACHIRKQPLPLNRDKASLPPAYDHLLKNS